MRMRSPLKSSGRRSGRLAEKDLKPESQKASPTIPFSLEAAQQGAPHRPLGDPPQRRLVLEEEGQVEGLELLHAELAELGERGGEHLHGAELQRLDLLVVLVAGAVGEDLDAHPAAGQLGGAPLEELGGLSLGRVDRHHVAEADDDGRLGGRGAGEGGEREEDEEGRRPAARRGGHAGAADDAPARARGRGRTAAGSCAGSAGPGRMTGSPPRCPPCSRPPSRDPVERPRPLALARAAGLHRPLRGGLPRPALGAAPAGGRGGPRRAGARHPLGGAEHPLQPRPRGGAAPAARPRAGRPAARPGRRWSCWSPTCFPPARAWCRWWCSTRAAGWWRRRRSRWSRGRR